MPIDPAKWPSVKEVFSAALEQPAASLGAFLDLACGSDLEVRQEVNRLLFEHFNAGNFLDEPLTVRHGAASPATEYGGSTPVFGSEGRFDVRDKLGSGGFGDVYEVFDRERRGLVALKYLRKFEPEQLYRLKREFRTLLDVRHPNVIQVYELFSSSDPPFFTMELLDGRDFGQHLRDTAQTPWAHVPGRTYDQLRARLLQLVHGVIALHDAHLVHRDIKPSNIFITGSGRVVLLDFGLVKHVDGVDNATTVAIAGTPNYSAPEQLVGAAATPATDWYAVGVILFEALTGRVPFGGAVMDVLRRKHDEDAPAPRSLVSDIPADLDDLCRHLLSRDPRRRPDGADVRRVLAECAPSSATSHTAAGSPARVLLGREPELAALERAFKDAEDGATVCVHIRGVSGVGKTRLIRSFLERLRETVPDCVVLDGRCYESEAAPHKGLDELVDRLALFLKGLDEQRARALLPRYFVLLTRLFPVLQQFQTGPRNVVDVADPREQRHRGLACLRECLARIAERHPLILWIDDLQWSDSDTVRLLNDLVQAQAPFGCLVLLSYRDSDMAANPVLAALEPPDRACDAASIRELEIENLSFEAARDLARALLRDRFAGTDGDPVADSIARESKGNPFFVTELGRYVAAMSEAGDLSAGAFGIGHVIKRRVGLLPDPALRLLEVMAVAGQPLASAVCVEAAWLGDSYHEIRGILTREYLVRTHVSERGEELDLYHDQVREAIAGSLSPEARVVYHGLLAQALEACGSSDHERLAFHMEAAGFRERAVTYMTVAAREADEALAFDRAARLFRRVLDLTSPTAPERARILEQLGDALTHAGRGREAAETFLQASEKADAMHRLNLQRRACEQYLRSGHLDEGLTLIRSLLSEVGLWYPQHPWAVVGSLLWHRFRLRLRTLAGTPVPTGRSAPVLERKLDVCWTGAVGMGMVDVIRGADFQARYTLLALKSGEPARMSLGLSAELAMGRMDGRRSARETERLFQAAMELATRTNNTYGIAFATSMKGTASWIAGDWADCYEKNRHAATIFREQCSGVLWELTTANTFALSALVFLGRWREHALTCPQLIRQAEERGDRYGAVSLPLLAYAYVHHLAADRPAEAHREIERALAEWPYRDFQIQHCDALFGHVETFLYEKRPRAAFEALQQQWPGLRASGLLHIHFYQVLMAMLRARAALALALTEPGQAGARLLRTARRDASRLVKQKTPWASAVGHLLAAGINTAERRSDQAVGHLHAAARLFARTEMTHYLAVTRLRLAELDARSAGETELAMQWMQAEGIVNAARIADALAPGRWTMDGA